MAARFVTVLPTTVVPTVDELYIVLKNSSIERKVLLTCLKVEPAKIREFKISNCGNEESAFVDTLEYFLKNKCPEEGQEWNQIIFALECNNDFKTAEIIRKQYLKIGNTVTVDNVPQYRSSSSTHNVPNEIDTDHGYCDFLPATPSTISDTPTTDTLKLQEERIEYLEKMKAKVITEYNEAKKNIDDSHYQVNQALEMECSEVRRMLTFYKQKMARSHNKIEKDIQDLIERTDANQKNVHDTITRLNQGDCTGIATLRQSTTELIDLERLSHKGLTGIERFKRNLPKCDTKPSTRANIIEELQQILLINSWPCDSIEDGEYMNIGDVLLNDSVCTKR